MRIVILLSLIFISSLATGRSLKDYLLPCPKEVNINNGRLQRDYGYYSLPYASLQRQSLLVNYQLDQSGIEARLLVFPASDQCEIIRFENCLLHEQGYELLIDTCRITIKASSETGFYYALLTLEQIGHFAHDHGYWPCLHIRDEPDFIRRGIMLDISRDKVPTMKTLEALIDQFSRMKLNEIQLYTEHTYAYKNHKVVWQNASPLTAEQIKILNQYCKDNFIDLVPNQNSFGHMNRWLQHPRYTHLAELEQPGKTIWGMRSKNTLSPVEEGSLKLVKELYAELLPHFSSDYFNIGCDETVELGVGKSKNLCQKEGKGRVYLHYLLELQKEVDTYQRRTQFWGDIILNHPELIDSLPKGMIPLIWGYEASYPFNENCSKFRDAGLDYYVCPGTSTWKSIVGRNENAFANIRNAALYGHKYGAMGFLNTNWGDHGHWQPLSVSYPSFLYGAAISWNTDRNKDIDIAHMTSVYFFNDSTDTAGQSIVNLGNAYLLTGALCDNSNIFHQLLQRNQYSIKTDPWLRQTTAQNLKNTIQYIQNQASQLQSSAIASYDSETVKMEIHQAAALVIFACKLGIAKTSGSDGLYSGLEENIKDEFKAELLSLIENHKSIWLLRNRPGGLGDSVKKMERIL